MVKKLAIKKKPAASKMASRKRPAVKKATIIQKLFIQRVWLVSLMVLTVIVAVSSYVWFEKKDQSTTDFMPIRLVEIEGDLIHISRDEIIEKLTKASKTNESIISESGVIGFFGSDLQSLEAILGSLAWVQKVELRRIWPDRLRIKVKEHKAIALWNETALINEFGKVFNPETVDGLTHLPSLSGPEQELEKLLKTFQELQLLLQPIELQLNSLNLNHRYSWSLELTNGIKLQVGRKHLLQRVERFIRLYPLLKSESDLSIEKVDLRYDTGLAVTRLETSEMQASL